MRKKVNRHNLQTPGLRVNWKCPRGHRECDDTPLRQQAYCRSCRSTYFWDEVERLGALKQLTRPSAMEARKAFAERS